MAKHIIESPYVSKNKQKDPRFSEAELELLKKLDEDSLKMFRSVFYQDELELLQIEKLKSVLTPDLVRVIKRFFIHDLDWREPLFGQPNKWDIPRFDALLTAEVKPVVKGRQKAIALLRKGVERLEELASGLNGKPRQIDIDLRMKNAVEGTDSEIKENVVAMQEFLKYLESAIQAINLYVMPEEDLKNIVEKLRKNSSK